MFSVVEIKTSDLTDLTDVACATSIKANVKQQIAQISRIFVQFVSLVVKEKIRPIRSIRCYNQNKNQLTMTISNVLEHWASIYEPLAHNPSSLKNF